MEISELETWMREALALARQAAARGEVPVGALLVRDGSLITAAGNERESRRHVAAHAEILALEAYGAQWGQWRLPPATVLITTAEPCLMCTGALLWARVSEVVYGCSDPKNAGLRLLLPEIEAGRFDHRFAVRGGILEKECAGELSLFFRRKRLAQKLNAS